MGLGAVMTLSAVALVASFDTLWSPGVVACLHVFVSGRSLSVVA